MPYGFGNIPGSTITGPLAKINSDGGRIVSNGSGRLQTESFVVTTGPSDLGPAGFSSDGYTIFSNGKGRLFCNTLTVGDYDGGGEITCHRIAHIRSFWNIATNGAVTFDAGAIWSNGYGELWANRFNGDGSGLSYVYAYGGYADNAGYCSYSDYANYSYNAYNADYAGTAYCAYDAGNAYYANYANDANNSYYAYQAYQSDYANNANYAYQADNAYQAYQANYADYASCANQLDSWSDCTIYGNCLVNTLQVATGNGLPPYPQNGTIASDGEYLYVYINAWRKLAFAD